MKIGPWNFQTRMTLFLHLLCYMKDETTETDSLNRETLFIPFYQLSQSIQS